MISVLLVDDEVELLHIGKLFLEQTGDIGVEICESASSALEFLQKDQFDAIVSDYQMPGMDGIEFLKYVRNGGSSIPFIIFTGRGREIVAIEALNNGATFYLQKGGDPKALFAELQNMIIQSVKRYEAEENLRESERKMTDIINFLPDATFAIDTGGIVIAWNRAMEEMTGVSRQEVLGKGDYCYAIPFYRERRPILIDLVLKRDEEFERKYQFIQQKDDKLISEIFIPLLYGGTGAYLWFTASPLYTTKGEVIGAIESIRDITERKKMEENLEDLNLELEEDIAERTSIKAALRQSEKQLQGIVHGSPIPQFVIDKDHRVISWNRALEEYSGVTAEEVLGTTMTWKAFYPDARPVLADLLVDNAIGDIPEWYIGKFNRSKYVEGAYEATDFFPKMGENGTWLYFTAAPLLDAEGGIVGAVETLEDITDIKKKEAALRESEEKYRMLANNTNDIIYTTDLQGIITYVSPQIARYGYDPEDFLSHPIGDIILEEDLPKVLDDFQTTVLTQKATITVFRIKDPAGNIIWLEDNGTPILDATGSVAGVSGILRDITDRIKAEDALRRARKSTGTSVRTSRK